MNTTFILIGLIAIVVLYVIVRFFIRNDSSKNPHRAIPTYKYTRKDQLMTGSEMTFFKMLQEVAGDRYYVFPQIHLSAILDYKVPGQSWTPAFRHINGKSVDFVLCEKNSLKPMYAVELDDSSHNLETRKERDREVERIFQESGLTLVRFTNYKDLSLDDIAKKFYESKERTTENNETIITHDV